MEKSFSSNQKIELSKSSFYKGTFLLSKTCKKQLLSISVEIYSIASKKQQQKGDYPIRPLELKQAQITIDQPKKANLGNFQQIEFATQFNI